MSTARLQPRKDMLLFKHIAVTATAFALIAVPLAGSANATPMPMPSAITGPGATIEDNGHEVIIEKLNPKGGGKRTIYTPAPGFTSATAYENLKKSTGVTKAPTKAPKPNIAAYCTYGTARTLSAPDGECPVRWTVSPGHVNPQVNFLDHSSSAWPEGAAVNDWNQSNNVNAGYVSSCPHDGSHCVQVFDTTVMADGTEGSTTYEWDGADNLIDGSVSIAYNDKYADHDYGQRRQNTCHETGHALGLDHNTTDGSCLYWQIELFFPPQHPSSDDFGLLQHVLYPR